jgi:hypothetical protein
MSADGELTSLAAWCTLARMEPTTPTDRDTMPCAPPTDVDSDVTPIPRGDAWRRASHAWDNWTDDDMVTEIGPWVVSLGDSR